MRNKINKRYKYNNFPVGISAYIASADPCSILDLVNEVTHGETACMIDLKAYIHCHRVTGRLFSYFVKNYGGFQPIKLTRRRRA